MPNSGATGFGMGSIVPAAPVSEELQQIVAGDQTAILQSMERSLRRLAEKFVETPIEQPNLFTLTGGAGAFALKLDYSTQPHNSVIICVLSGTLNLWLGDYVGQPQTASPNAGQYSLGPPSQLFFPLNGRVYTVVNPSSAVTLVASIIPVAI